MAGIILDINDDIKRLQQLKAEIESVKKALTSINVKVDIDIAKGLEARLQKLMGQYDALVGKIAASEAKVKEAESRMNSATQRIMEAQERMAQAATGQGTNTSKSGNTTAANAQTASIKEQARAYDELEKEIDGVLGTRDENVRLMVEEQNAIRILNAQIKEVRKNYTGSDGVVSQRGLQLLEKYNNDLLTHKAALSQVRQELLNQAKLNNAAGTSMNALSQSLSRMRIAYRELTEEERKSSFGQELLASIQQADAKIKELDATIGNHQRNVGNYASGFNSLGMSVQQIVRELPAATMGLNMFFLAISNNLPILTDEIKRAAEANKALKAQNQETIPVWKQLVSSIFSWQTALIVAITAMSMYGKEIVSWIGNLFKAKDATEEVRIEQEKLNKSMADARKSAAEETAGLRTLYSMTQNQNASMQDRLAAVNKLQQQYPAYFGNISKEAILAGQASAAYQQLTKDIMAAAYARAYQERMEDLASRNVDELRGSRADFNWMQRNKKAYDAAKAYMDSTQGKADRNQYVIFSTRTNGGVDFDPEAVARYEKYMKTVEAFEERRSRWQRHNENYKRNEATMADYEAEILKRQSALMKTEQGSDYVEDTKSQENEAKRIAKERERIAKERLKAQSDVDKDLLSLQQKNQDDEIALMRDGTEKKLAEIDNDYEKRIAEIERQEAEFKEKNKEAGLQGLSADGLTSDQSKALEEARNNAEKKRHTDTQKLLSDENKARVTALQDYLKSYGDYEQKRLAITQEYQQKIADAETSGERLNLQAQLEDALSELDFNQFKEKFNWEDIFGNLGDLTLEQLKNVRTQLRALLSDSSLSVEDYKTAVEQIDKINEAIVSEQDKLKGAFGLILPMAEERRKLEMDVTEANARQNELLAEQQELLGGIEAKRQSLATILQNAGLDINASDVNIGNQDAILSQVESIFGLDSDIYKNVSKSFDELNNSERDLNNTTQKLGKAQADATSAQSKLNKFLSDFGNKLQAVSEVMSLVNSNLQSLPDLLSQLGVDMGSALGKGVTDLVNASQSAASAFQDAMSGNFVGALSNGMKAVTGLFSGFTNVLGFGGNDKEVAETVNRLTESNEYLRESIDRLKERIDESAGGQAIDYYEKAAEAESEWQENQLEIIKKLAGAWTNSGYGFLGLSGKKSFNSHAPGGGWEGWDAFTKTLQENGFKITIDEVGDLWGLTPEQMALLRDNNPKEWQKLFSGDGHKNPLDEVNEYIEHAGELEGLMETLNENLTQTSFDSLRSSFLDTLMDMESDAQDFTDDFSSMMQRALLNYAMGDEFDQWLKQWYDSLSDEIRNSGGDLSDIDVGAFREEWEQKAEEWLNMRDWLAGITGYTGDTEKGQQSASSKGYETMSQDMAGELSGRFTALNETGLRIEAQGNAKMQTLADLKGSVAGLEIQAQGIYNIADETRSILANSYLELQEINENTGNSAKFLKDIKADIAIVKQNTSRI